MKEIIINARHMMPEEREYLVEQLSHVYESGDRLFRITAKYDELMGSILVNEEKIAHTDEEFQ